MNKLPVAKRAQILEHALRGVVDAVDLPRGGRVDQHRRPLPDPRGRGVRRVPRRAPSRTSRRKRVQCDEIWSFCGMKEKTAKKKGADRPEGAGDVWTWTAIDADSKLIIGWLVGGPRTRAAPTSS